MPPVTDVVKNLIILNVLMYAGTYFGLEGQGIPLLALHYPASEYFLPVQLVTHMFMHGDLFHLLFNMYALYMFGTALESYWGPARFLKFYLICGFGAIALHLGVWHWELSQLPPAQFALAMQEPFMAVLGASGAVFGLLAGYGTLFPDNRIGLLFPPIVLKAKYFVIIFAVIELSLGFSGASTGIAHFAHLGGALFGFLLVRYWQRGGNMI